MSNVDEMSQFEATAADNLGNQVEVPSAPAHNYNTREGYLYGYIGAVSEEDQKRGRVAGDVLMFRYEGVHEGLYRLTQFNAAGRAVGSFECNNPCVAIKAYTWAGAQRWAFSADSVIGAAFLDAFNHQLVAYKPPPPPPLPAAPVIGQSDGENNLALSDAMTTENANVPTFADSDENVGE